LKRAQAILPQDKIAVKERVIDGNITTTMSRPDYKRDAVNRQMLLRTASHSVEADAVRTKDNDDTYNPTWERRVMMNNF